MESLNLLLEGFGQALTPMNLLWVFIGALLGTAVGVLPGLGSSMAVALLLPMTFSLDPVGAFIMFAGVYFGGFFGDSTAIATTFEGHRMAKDGRAPQALATSAIGAFIGGLIATTLVVFFAPKLAEVAVLFGPAEYFALAVFAFIAAASVVSDSALKGLASLLFCLALAVVGIDGISGASRFTANVPQLFDGVSIIVITVGVLALGEVLHVASRIHRDQKLTAISVSDRPYLSRLEVREAIPAWLRGTAFGVPFGVIPVGALLALSLPTSATAAIRLAAFQQYGLQPGPMLFERNADLVWALLASLFVGLVMLLVLNLPFALLWAKLLLIPKPHLFAGIAVFCGLGVYATGASAIDLHGILK